MLLLLLVPLLIIWLIVWVNLFKILFKILIFFLMLTLLWYVIKWWFYVLYFFAIVYLWIKWINYVYNYLKNLNINNKKYNRVPYWDAEIIEMLE